MQKERSRADPEEKKRQFRPVDSPTLYGIGGAKVVFNPDLGQV